MKTPNLDAMCDCFDLCVMTVESRGRLLGDEYRWQAALRPSDSANEDVAYTFDTTRKLALRKLERMVADKLYAVGRQMS